MLRRLLGRPPGAPPNLVHFSLLELARMKDACDAGKRRVYRTGLQDGIAMVLNQLEGRVEFDDAPAGPELTDEVRDWIALVRSNLDQIRAAEERV